MDKELFLDTLPNVPTSIEIIRTFFGNDEVTPQKLVEFLEFNPVLSLHVLHLVNSPYYGLSQNVTSVRQAVMLLGNVMIRGIILAAVIKKSFPADVSAYNISMGDFEQITHMRLKLLTKLIENLDVDKGSLFSVALLMEDGKLITSNILKTKNLLESFQEKLESNPIESVEQEFLDLTSYEAMKILLLKWNFDETFAFEFEKILDPNTLEETLLHILIVLINVHTVFDADAVESVRPLVSKCGIDEKLFLETIEEMKEEL